MNYYVIDDFNEVLRYFDTFEAALNYCHDKSRICIIDFYSKIGDCLL